MLNVNNALVNEVESMRIATTQGLTNNDRGLLRVKEQAIKNKNELKEELKEQAIKNKNELKEQLNGQAIKNKNELKGRLDVMFKEHATVIQGLIKTLAESNTSRGMTMEPGERHEHVIKRRMKELQLNVFDRACLKEMYDIMFYAYIHNKRDLVLRLMETKWARYCSDEDAPGLEFYVGNFAKRYGQGWYQNEYGHASGACGVRHR